MSRRLTGLALVCTLGAGLACGSGEEGVVWDEESTWTCGGTDDKVIEGVTKVLRTENLIGIEANGSCQLRVVNCDITADFPIKAAGNATVTIEGGRIHGNKQSLQAMGNGRIVVSGATIEGEPGTAGNGKIEGL